MLLPSSTMACVTTLRRRTTGRFSTRSLLTLSSPMLMFIITPRPEASSTTMGVTRTSVPAVTVYRLESWKPETRM